MSWFDDVFSADIWGDWSDVWSVGKAILPIAGAIGGAAIQSDANQSAADRTIQATQAQADQLQLGIDERLIAQLGGIDAARAYLDQRLATVTDIYRVAAERFGGDIRTAAQAYAQAVPQAAALASQLIMSGAQSYGDAMRVAASTAGQELRSAGQEYGQTVTGAAGQYDQRLQSAAADYARLMQEAPEAIRKMLGPYADVGLETLPIMRQIAFGDPNRLTESQRIATEDAATRNAQGLALRGLRGSGASVAAVLDAENRMKAGFYDQNRDRQDAYLRLLGQYGYGAAGTIGQTDVNTINATANRLYEADATGGRAMLDAYKLAADAAFKARQQAAAWGLDAEKAAQDAYLKTLTQAGAWQYGAARDSASALYGAERDVASNYQNTAGKLAGAYDSYFGQLGNYAATEAGYIGDAAYGKREAEARALGPIAAVQGAADQSDARLWGSAIGSITRMIADDRVNGWRPSSYAGGSSYGNDTYRGGNDTVGLENWGYL